MFKKIISVLLALCLMPTYTLAVDWNEKYKSELTQLNAYLQTGGENTSVDISNVYDQFEANGRIGEYTMEFGIYAKVLKLLEEGNYEEALSKASELNTNASFAGFRAYLEDGVELKNHDLYALDPTQMLYDYARGRLLEAKSSWSKAAEAYDSSIKFMDSMERKEYALSVTPKPTVASSPTLVITPTPMSTPGPTPEPTATPIARLGLKVGDYIKFGSYPQTRRGNDYMPIEWQILDIDGDCALLLSRYGLDSKSYNETFASITWEDCTLRRWLNDTFINRAFTAEEQAVILMTNVNNKRTPSYFGSGGNNTWDKVFLLSYAEVKKYFEGERYDKLRADCRVVPTDYARAHGASTYGNDKTADNESVSDWWLRSPGDYQWDAAYVTTSDSIYESRVDTEYFCVRPALWVNLVESGVS